MVNTVMASGSTERAQLLRRLILLIFVDWLPPDFFFVAALLLPGQAA
jgi:hypothetical protein